MTSITWASPRYVQELTTILGPQNRTQGSCVWKLPYFGIFKVFKTFFSFFFLKRGMGLSPKVPTDAFKKYV